MDGQRDRR